MRSYVLIMVFCFVSMSAFSAEYVAKSFSYSDSGRDGMSQNFYSCDYAESALSSHLEKLGAIDINVRCSGGIEHGSYSPVNLNSSFKVTKFTDPSTAKIEVATLKSRGSDSPCFFNTKLLNQLVKYFPNVYVDSKKASCFDNRTSWKYVLRIAQ
jgi:hypothetical protein